MDRRTFFKAILGVAATAVVARQLPWFAPAPVLDKPFHLDKATKTILFTGDEGKVYTVLEFHRYLQSQADRVQANSDFLDITDPIPSTRITDHLIRLEDGISLDDNAAPYLSEGSIVQKDIVWSSRMSWGTLDLTSKLLRTR